MYCGTPTRHHVSGKGVTNLRTINLLAYIILNNYLENINLQKISYISTIVVFTVSCTYIMSSIYLYFYIYIVFKILHLHLQNQVKPTCDGPYNCVGPIVCGISRTSSSVPTRINTRTKLYSSVGIHKYGRPLKRSS